VSVEEAAVTDDERARWAALKASPRGAAAVERVKAQIAAGEPAALAVRRELRAEWEREEEEKAQAARVEAARRHAEMVEEGRRRRVAALDAATLARMEELVGLGMVPDVAIWCAERDAARLARLRAAGVLVAAERRAAETCAWLRRINERAQLVGLAGGDVAPVVTRVTGL
jgi:hypothetical protein